MASAWNADTDSVDFTVGLLFPVNDKPGEDWQIVVSYEPCDEYAVWLTALVEGRRVLVATRDGVYGSDLKEAVIEIYDQAINDRNGGFINLGEE
jgi:hypothetical protein